MSTAVEGKAITFLTIPAGPRAHCRVVLTSWALAMLLRPAPAPVHPSDWSCSCPAQRAGLKLVTARAGVKETPLASDDVLFVTSNVKLQRMHDLAVSMPPGNYLPPVPGDCQPNRHASLASHATAACLVANRTTLQIRVIYTLQGIRPGACALRRRLPSGNQAERRAVQRADVACSVRAGGRHLQPA